MGSKICLCELVNECIFANQNKIFPPVHFSVRWFRILGSSKFLKLANIEKLPPKILRIFYVNNPKIRDQRPKKWAKNVLVSKCYHYENVKKLSPIRVIFIDFKNSFSMHKPSKYVISSSKNMEWTKFRYGLWILQKPRQKHS